MARLPDAYREVVRRRQERRSYAEIGAALGLSSDAVRARLTRLIARVRAELDHG